MIQIDDAGSGSLLGGTIIGIYRVETGEYEYDVIPLEYYRNDAFDQKLYLDYVVTIVKKIFQKLNVSTEEEILVCRGYMFDQLKIWLKSNNYSFLSTEIKDPLQSRIEVTFENYAVHLGLPSRFISYTKYPFHFHRILKWIYADYENRSLLCKTGWKSWKKYGSLGIQLSHEKVKNKNLMCLKCNNLIPQNTDALVKTYYSNRMNKIFLHPQCT